MAALAAYRRVETALDFDLGLDSITNEPMGGNVMKYKHLDTIKNRGLFANQG